MVQDKTKDNLEDFESVIGLEIHVELSTQSKMFCGCSANYFGESPNSHTCPVCLGLPGALPIPNRKAIDYCIMVGLSLNCEVPKFSKFDRKNYFYPDLPKGYQISQYDQPFCQNGHLIVQASLEAASRKVSIIRVHQEEDTGKLIHAFADGIKVSLVDFNRSGVPLIEIVTGPDLRNASEAKLFVQKVRQIVRYLGVSDGDMEKGSLRCDANVSVRKKGDKKLGVKVEIKNMNSFRSVERALNAEIERQMKALRNGGKIVQETRGWSEKEQVTMSQRGKEGASDYRYFPEPDIPPFTIDGKYVSYLRNLLPELPDAKVARFQKDYKLSFYDANVISEDKALTDWFEEAVKVYQIEKDTDKDVPVQAKRVANWIMGPILGYINENKKGILDLSLTAANLVELLHFMDDGKITNNVAKAVLDEVLRKNVSVLSVIDKGGYLMVVEKNDLESAVEQILSENGDAVAKFKAGKEAVLGFLIGQAMRKVGGKADPKLVEKIIREKIT